MAYIHFTDEQKQQANSVDLVDFLQRQGEQLIRSGREWRWKRHDSVTVRGNQWFRHSRKEGGHAIDFVQQFYDMSFPEAITIPCSERTAAWNGTKPPRARRRPVRNSLSRSQSRYATGIRLPHKQRFIDRDVLSHFAHHKLIYEDKEYHNTVFVGLMKKASPATLTSAAPIPRVNPTKETWRAAIRSTAFTGSERATSSMCSRRRWICCPSSR